MFQENSILHISKANQGRYVLCYCIFIVFYETSIGIGGPLGGIGLKEGSRQEVGAGEEG